jgi:hypothetical protein
VVASAFFRSGEMPLRAQLGQLRVSQVCFVVAQGEVATHAALAEDVLTQNRGCGVCNLQTLIGGSRHRRWVRVSGIGVAVIKCRARRLKFSVIFVAISMAVAGRGM